ncbi:MAG: prepilin-type N-terminal cleavage/methylation domain-containing protein [Limnobacter sp.]|nr:prepilin-type N-terminal cleavage/methylation domain-containing protein [Limnobacter sp.]
MNVFSKPAYNGGFSILEALVSIVILSIGISAFGKSYIYTVNTNTHIQDQLVSLHLGSEINNLTALHALTLTETNPNDFFIKVNAFAADIERDINFGQKRENYECSNSGNEAVPVVRMGGGYATPTQFLLTEAFQDNAFSCVKILVSQSETVNGVPNVWINTRVSWVSRGVQGNEIQSVDSAKLAVGKDLPGQYIKYWY